MTRRQGPRRGRCVHLALLVVWFGLALVASPAFATAAPAASAQVVAFSGSGALVARRAVPGGHPTPGSPARFRPEPAAGEPRARLGRPGGDVPRSPVRRDRATNRGSLPPGPARNRLGGVQPHAQPRDPGRDVG